MTDFALKTSQTKVSKFMIAGASKRGWTTWTTAAVDKRVMMKLDEDSTTTTSGVSNPGYIQMSNLTSGGPAVMARSSFRAVVKPQQPDLSKDCFNPGLYFPFVPKITQKKLFHNSGK